MPAFLASVREAGADQVEQSGRSERAEQAGHAQHRRDRQLRQGVLTQTPKELWSDLVAGGEQEEIEEEGLHEGGHLDVELADQDARQQRAHHGAEGEGADPQLADEEADRQREEDGELDGSEEPRRRFHDRYPPSLPLGDYRWPDSVRNASMICGTWSGRMPDSGIRCMRRIVATCCGGVCNTSRLSTASVWHRVHCSMVSAAWIDSNSAGGMFAPGWEAMRVTTSRIG